MPSSLGSPGKDSPRDNALDALRTLAVLAMMAAHASRLIAFDARPAWSRWVLLLEPLIPTLFLLLVGLSLARSFEAACARNLRPRAWYLRQLGRAALLWGVSALFFSLENGVRLPDALIASGILATIAHAIAIVGGLLALSGTSPGKMFPVKYLPLPLALTAGIMLFVWLDAAGAHVFPLNSGNSPFLPLWLFALAGAWWGRMSGSIPAERTSRAPSLPWFLPTIGVMAGAVGIWLVARYGVDTLFAKPFGRSDAGRLTPAPFHGGSPVHIAYYNLRPVLALASLGLQLGALTLLSPVLKKLGEGGAGIVFALGRHALGAYILHLALLATLVVTIGPRPLTYAWQVGAVWVAVALICQIWAIRRESLRRENLGMEKRLNR